MNLPVLPAQLDNPAPLAFKVFTASKLDRIPQLEALAKDQRFAMRVVSSVLPFRVNQYVIDELIDWSRAPDDPLFQLTFPQRGMLSEAHFDRMASLLTRLPVRRDVAMTGEITLRGKVLPIGGLKEKVLAAHRIGIRTIIMPRDNEKDLADIPSDIQKYLEFKLVDTMDEVLKIALEGDLPNLDKIKEGLPKDKDAPEARAFLLHE